VDDDMVLATDSESIAAVAVTVAALRMTTTFGIGCDGEDAVTTTAGTTATVVAGRG
tara:strand:- start:717 stop:884 length:168 start_codon:yes stop_codon:yes gene_type:complete